MYNNAEAIIIVIGIENADRILTYTIVVFALGIYTRSNCMYILYILRH